MKIDKNIILLSLLMGLGVRGFCFNVSENPTVDFGTINYLYGTSGSNQITISADPGPASLSGSGYIMNQSGGSAGTVSFSVSGGIQELIAFISLSIKTDSYNTSNSSSCGQATISNIHTNTNGRKTATNGNPASFPIGATLTLNSFVSSVPCTIEETFSAVMSGSSILGGSKDVSLTIRVAIIPNMAVTHNTGSSLNFGSICSSPSVQQTLTIAPDGGVSGTYICPTQNTSADSFTVTGNIWQSFSVNLDNSTTITNGSNSLTVSSLTPSCSSNCTLTAINVGGTLTVPANTPVGEYTGNYQLSITY